MLLFFITPDISAQSGQKWATDGNSISNDDFIGTTNNLSLLFKVNNAQALLIKYDGNLFVNSLNLQHNNIQL